MKNDALPAEKAKRDILPRPRWLYSRWFAIAMGLLFFAGGIVPLPVSVIGFAIRMFFGLWLIPYAVVLRPARTIDTGAYLLTLPVTTGDRVLSLVGLVLISIVFTLIVRKLQQFRRIFRLLVVLQLVIGVGLSGFILVISSSMERYLFDDSRTITGEQVVSEAVRLRAEYQWTGEPYQDPDFCVSCFGQTHYSISHDNGQTWSLIATWSNNCCFDGEFEPEVMVQDEQTFWMWFEQVAAFTEDGGQTWHFWHRDEIPEEWRDLLL